MFWILMVYLAVVRTCIRAICLSFSLSLSSVNSNGRWCYLCFGNCLTFVWLWWRRWLSCLLWFLSKDLTCRAFFKCWCIEIYRHLRKAVLSTLEDEDTGYDVYDLWWRPYSVVFFCVLIIIFFHSASADIDECLTVGICDHDCVNTNGSYKCRCAESYVLEPPRTCRPQGKVSSQGCWSRFCVWEFAIVIRAVHAILLLDNKTRSK